MPPDLEAESGRVQAIGDPAGPPHGWDGAPECASRLSLILAAEHALAGLLADAGPVIPWSLGA